MHGNRLNLEDNSEQVKIGKVIHEEKAQGHKNTEIAIDNIRLDQMDQGTPYRDKNQMQMRKQQMAVIILSQHFKVKRNCQKRKA